MVALTEGLEDLELELVAAGLEFLQIPLFGAGENGKLPLTTYAQFLKSNNVRITGVVTEARFDTNSPTPKLTFRAVRPLTEEEYFLAKERGKSTEALSAISMDPAAMDTAAQPAKQPAPQPVFAAKEPEPVAVAEPVVVAEPVKRETKKTEAPSNLESLLDEWED